MRKRKIIFNNSEYAGILLQMKLRFSFKRKQVSVQRGEESSNKQVGVPSILDVIFGVKEECQVSILLNPLIYFPDCPA